MLYRLLSPTSYFVLSCPPYFAVMSPTLRLWDPSGRCIKKLNLRPALSIPILEIPVTDVHDIECMVQLMTTIIIQNHSL